MQCDSAVSYGMARARVSVPGVSDVQALQKSEREKPHCGGTNQHAPTQTTQGRFPVDQPGPCVEFIRVCYTEKAPNACHRRGTQNTGFVRVCADSFFRAVASSYHSSSSVTRVVSRVHIQRRGGRLLAAHADGHKPHGSSHQRIKRQGRPASRPAHSR